MADINNEELNELRKEIDKIDSEILRLVKERENVGKKVGALKKANGLPLRDPGREAEMLEVNCRKTTLPSKLVKDLLRLLIEHTLEMEGYEVELREREYGKEITDEDVEWIKNSIQRHTRGFEAWFKQAIEIMSGEDFIRLILTTWEAGRKK